MEFIKRHLSWLLLIALSLFLFQPAISEYKLILLIITIEALAIALSGVASFCYTKLDFTKDYNSFNLGFIFLGVHICVGLAVLGVYLAQF